MECANYPYLQLRAKLNCEGHSSTSPSGRLSKGAYSSHLFLAITEHSCDGRDSNPTFPVGGNRNTQRKPMTFGRVLTNSFHITIISRPNANWTHVTGKRRALWQMRHRSTLIIHVTYLSTFHKKPSHKLQLPSPSAYSCPQGHYFFHHQM